MIPVQYSYVVTYSIPDENIVSALDTMWYDKALSIEYIHKLVRQHKKDFFNSESSFFIHQIAGKTRLSPEYAIKQLKFLFFSLLYSGIMTVVVIFLLILK